MEKMALRRPIKSASASPVKADVVESSNDGVVLGLSIALGVALIVVIVLVCVYVSRNNGDNTCPDGNSVEYLDIDILSDKKPDTVLAAASMTGNKASVLSAHGATGATTAVNTGSGATGATGAIGTLPSQKQEYKKITADMANALADKDDISIIIGVSGTCHACKSLMTNLKEIDASEIYVLDVSSRPTQQSKHTEHFKSAYVPQWYTVGKGIVIKGKTGAMPASAISSYISEEKKKF